MTERRPVEPADLQADCASCVALCCTVLRFDRSADFAFGKRAGTPCHHLADDLRCSIHEQLRPRGMSGCAVYDCQGAGQKVSRVILADPARRTDARPTRWAIDAFPVVRQLHEILAYLLEARDRWDAADHRAEVETTLAVIDRLTHLTGTDLLRVDVAAHRATAGELLERVSATVRAPTPPRSLRHADLAGADLHGQDLRRHDLRGALLIGADLRGADLRGADLLGADLRDADLRGTRLDGALFLTVAQRRSARGADPIEAS